MLHKEFELLRTISRMNLNPEERERFINIVNDKEFIENQQSYLNVITRHKLQYLFYKHLYENHLLLHHSIRELSMILSERFYFLQSKHFEFTSELKKVVESLNSENVKYAILKGISIADPLYMRGDLVYRNYNDIDILITKQDVNKVKKLLNDINFWQASVSETYDITNAERKDLVFWSLNSHQEHKFIKPSSLFRLSPRFILKIDINTTIFEGGKVEPRMPTVKLLDKCETRKSIGIGSYYTLNKTFELIQLCFHFYKDTMYAEKRLRKENIVLIKFCDIYEYIMSYYDLIDWDVFNLNIDRYNIRKEIEYVLSLVVDYYEDDTFSKLVNNCVKNMVLVEYSWDKLLDV